MTRAAEDDCFYRVGFPDHQSFLRGLSLKKPVSGQYRGLMRDSSSRVGEAMTLFECFCASPEDGALRRSIASHVRRVLHDGHEELSPTYLHNGVGIKKITDEEFELHVKLPGRTRTLRSELTLSLRGFFPEAWPPGGDVMLVFQVDVWAGNTARTTFEFSTEEEAALRVLANDLTSDGYAPTKDILQRSFAGESRVELCRKRVPLPAARFFEDAPGEFLAAMLAGEHGRLVATLRTWRHTQG